MLERRDPCDALVPKRKTIKAIVSILSATITRERLQTRLKVALKQMFLSTTKASQPAWEAPSPGRTFKQSSAFVLRCFFGEASLCAI